MATRYSHNYVANVVPNRSNLPCFQQVLVRLDHDCRVQCVAWSPQTTLVSAPKLLQFATGGADHCVRLYATDMGSQDTVKVLRGHTDYVNALAFQPGSGGQLASGSDDHRQVRMITINQKALSLL